MTTLVEVRPPAVAGRFYPAEPEALELMLRRLLAAVPADAPRQPFPAVMVPHAGLEFSGACAAQVFGRLVWPETVVILAPNHTGRGVPGQASLWDRGSFSTPLGPVAVDADLCEALLARSRLVARDHSAHSGEHAIEVQLPFLQLLAPGTRIVPLVLPWDDWPRCAGLGRTLAGLMEERRGNLLLIASSDMTHYEPAPSAGRKDRIALERVTSLDGAGLLEACRREGITMCGRAAAATVLEAARLLGATRGQVVDYRHSGLASGDDREVVSYAGVVLERPQPPGHCLRFAGAGG